MGRGWAPKHEAQDGLPIDSGVAQLQCSFICILHNGLKVLQSLHLCMQAKQLISVRHLFHLIATRHLI